MIEIDEALKGYLEERLDFKKDVYSEISSNYNLDLGGDFSKYASKISKVYGHDILSVSAADALYAVGTGYGNKITAGSLGRDSYDSWVQFEGANNLISGTHGLLRTVNRRNLNKELTFPGVSCLILDSVEKFSFWFLGNRYKYNGINATYLWECGDSAAVRFPDLTALIVIEDPIPRPINEHRIPENKYRILFSKQFFAPNLRIVSDNLSVEYVDGGISYNSYGFDSNIEFVNAKQWLRENYGMEI